MWLQLLSWTEQMKWQKSQGFWLVSDRDSSQHREHTYSRARCKGQAASTPPATPCEPLCFCVCYCSLALLSHTDLQNRKQTAASLQSKARRSSNERSFMRYAGTGSHPGGMLMGSVPWSGLRAHTGGKENKKRAGTMAEQRGSLQGQKGKESSQKAVCRAPHQLHGEQPVCGSASKVDVHAVSFSFLGHHFHSHLGHNELLHRSILTTGVTFKKVGCLHIKVTFPIYAILQLFYSDSRM